MAVGDVYELRLNGVHISGQLCAPVWNYEVTDQPGNPSTASTFGITWLANWLTDLLLVTGTAWDYENVSVVNLDDVTDFADTVIAGGAGTRVGITMPPNLAVSFRSPRNDIGVNRSGHRMPLLVTGDMANDGSMVEASRNDMYLVQQLMGLPFGDANNTYSPVIIKKTYVGGEFTGYTIRAEVTGQWELNRFMGTQKTRQEYRWQIAEEPV